MKKFIKEYPMIVVALFISCLVIFSCVIFRIKIQDYAVVTIVFQLAIGIVINSIFFYMQIYLVRKKQMEYVDKCIIYRISLIQNGMREIFDRLGELYLNVGERTDKFDETLLLMILQRTVTEDYINLIDPTKVGRVMPSEFTVKEFILQKISYIEREIDRLCTYYCQYISPDLMEILESILNSNMHNDYARIYLQSSNGVDFKNISQDIFYMPYFELISKLEVAKKQYYIQKV